ncbi:MAG: serine hydrolase [Minisyncoccia bacterium]
MLEYTKKNLYIIVTIFAIFFIGLFLGRYTKQSQVIKNRVLRESGYKYINPILLCNTDNQQSYNHDNELSGKLSNYVEKNKENDISIYYLSLTNGYWASINENVSYSPASMLKVPTVVDAMKFSETHPEILLKQLYYEGSVDYNKPEYFRSKESIQPGRYYTIKELFEYIIRYSDNNALTLLLENINSRSLDEIYKDLNITIPENNVDFMNTRTYSLFLRILYNSTYLNREDSEKILKIMTESDFYSGLRKQIPKEIEIASKFGEREIHDTSGNTLKKELHECGIIYKKDDPYVLCVMTSGNNLNSLSTNISDISKIVFNYVNN